MPVPGLLPSPAEDRAAGRRRYEVTIDGWVIVVTLESAERAALRERALRSVGGRRPRRAPGHPGAHPGTHRARLGDGRHRGRGGRPAAVRRGHEDGERGPLRRVPAPCRRSRSRWATASSWAPSWRSSGDEARMRWRTARIPSMRRGDRRAGPAVRVTEPADPGRERWRRRRAPRPCAARRSAGRRS